jgi:uncharacterized protein (DUF1499 family)
MTMTDKANRLAICFLLLAIIGAAAVLVMMFGARFGLWEPIIGFRLTRTYLAPMGYVLAGAGFVGLTYLAMRRKVVAACCAALATVVGLGMLSPTIKAQLHAPKRYPPIHDISTDTINPPRFVILDGARSGAQNGLTYGGPEVAAVQATSYPDVAPIQSTLPATDAFARALSVAKDMGWDIVAQNPDALRFEATAYTPIFHFADDIVVVFTPEAAASRVDLRSVSRVGRSDMGVNAARILAFAKKFKG